MRGFQMKKDELTLVNQILVNALAYFIPENMEGIVVGLDEDKYVVYNKDDAFHVLKYSGPEEPGQRIVFSETKEM